MERGAQETATAGQGHEASLNGTLTGLGVSAICVSSLWTARNPSEARAELAGIVGACSETGMSDGVPRMRARARGDVMLGVVMWMRVITQDHGPYILR